jgi:RNA polymerase sigma factor (sigma-70 family)
VVKSVFRGEMERVEDLRLLRRYAQDGCAASFEAVVRKHIGWVYSASARQVGDPDLAQDVTQAVFILLARRAATLSDQTVLTGWLFNTLRFTAREARRKEARRRKHESRAARAPGARTADAPAPDDIDDQAWQAMAPLLDDAVTVLSEADRQAVLLRFYEGRDFADIADLLGVNESAARKRVSRAVQRLGRYFKKRGIALPLAALAATLLARTSEAAPFGLSESILSSITGGATLTPIATTLLRRTSRHLLRAKRRLATAIAAVMGLLGVAVTGLLLAAAFDRTPDLAPLETETPLPWASRNRPIPRLPEMIVLPTDETRGRLVIQTAPPTDPTPTPEPLAASDAFWWVRQWFNPAHAPTPDTQAARRAPSDANRAPADAVDPATGLPRPNPNAPRPGDVVESYAQMGGGGGPTVTANTRGGAPVGGELNGASAHSTPAGDTTGPGPTLATTLVNTVVASNGSATADAALTGTLTVGPSVAIVYDRNIIPLSQSTPRRQSGWLTYLAARSPRADIAFNGNGSSWVIVQYDADAADPDYNTQISVVSTPDGALLKIAFDEDGATKTVTLDPRHLADSPELVQLPPEVRNAINIITPLSLISDPPALQVITFTATPVPEPTTPLLLTTALLALSKRRRRRRR